LLLVTAHLPLWWAEVGSDQWEWAGIAGNIGAEVARAAGAARALFSSSQILTLCCGAFL